MSMKKSVKALTFAAAAMATGMAVSGCWGSFGGTVYGPPPSQNTTETTTKVTESEKPTEATLPSSYDPTIEPEVDVYGPPPDSMD
jgi:hypothetical protein